MYTFIIDNFNGIPGYMYMKAEQQTDLSDIIILPSCIVRGVGEIEK